MELYLLSDLPESRTVFIYGPPGSGKTTTLYKTFLNYKIILENTQGSLIPVFIHANELESFLDSSNKKNISINEFLKQLYQKSEISQFREFVNLLNDKQPQSNSVNFVIIIDAIDEFVSKTKRKELFEEYLSPLITSQSGQRTKWILSCREEEYNAFRTSLKVANVQIQPMDLKQLLTFQKKRLKTHNIYSNKEIEKIQWETRNIAHAIRQGEFFLQNPYYLSLWIDRLPSSKEDFSLRIPSLNELHQFEIKKEIARSKGQGIVNVEDVDKYLVENTVKVLSVASYYLLRFSLQRRSELRIKDFENFLKSTEILKSLEAILQPIEADSQDPVTKRRLNQYLNPLTSRSTIQPDNININQQDLQFISFLNILKLGYLSQEKFLSSDKAALIIVIASIIEQSYKTNLISDDPEQAAPLKFLNQRVGDYLAACYLKSQGLTNIISLSNINFWLFRAISIAIATSDNIQDILALEALPRDHVFETAIVNGLILISSEKKSELEPFLKRFLAHLTDIKRLSKDEKEYDPCEPLRVLRLIKSLCLNGYSKHIKLPKESFHKLLKHKDVGISQEATEILLIYAYQQIRFNKENWRFLFSHLFSKAISFQYNYFFELLRVIKEMRK